IRTDSRYPEVTVVGAGGEKLLRRLLGFAGLLALFSALFGDQIGLSSGDGFSRNQIMIAVLGAVLVAASILWNKCIRIYRNASVVAMNFLLALVASSLSPWSLSRCGTRGLSP
ncbi:MAG: hypothetical protein KA108_09125, partial [Candidatus Fermentibacter sp.]|nr:hypothetical protein [Candidatus Fermentibacter sp.]